MSRMIFADNALSTLAGPVLAGDESFTLSITTNFPDFQEGDFTFFRFGNTAAAPDIKVLGRDGNVFACEPLPQDFPAGTMVGLVPCRRMFEVFAQSILMGLTAGTITTLSAGSEATATITGDPPNQALNLGIPRGANGTNGTNGVDGQDAPLLTLDLGDVLTCDYGTPAAASIVGDNYPNLLLNLRLPAGPPGADSITLTMGDVETLAPGATATAEITGTAPDYVLNLGIPAGFDGADGADGTNGTNGSPGPANSLSIGTVQTLSAGASATATITGTAPNQTLNLGIPQGVAGSGGLSTRAGLPREIWIDAGAQLGRASNGAAAATVETATNKVCYDVWDFDAAAIEYGQFKLVLPAQWDGGTIKAKFYWTAASGSGDVIWGIQAASCADGDALDQAWGTVQTVTDTLGTANTCRITAATSALTIANSPAPGDLILLQIYRNATNGGDTLGVDGRLLGVFIQYMESSAEAAAW